MTLSPERVRRACCGPSERGSALSFRRPVCGHPPLPPAAHRPEAGLQGGSWASALTAAPPAACSSRDSGRLPPAPAVSPEQGRTLRAGGGLSAAWPVPSAPTSRTERTGVSMPFSLFFCSDGRRAFHDFGEVFLCSRKCKCHAWFPSRPPPSLSSWPPAQWLRLSRSPHPSPIGAIPAGGSTLPAPPLLPGGRSSALQPATGCLIGAGATRIRS